jgi:hypothetical protein
LSEFRRCRRWNFAIAVVGISPSSLEFRHRHRWNFTIAITGIRRCCRFATAVIVAVVSPPLLFRHCRYFTTARHRSRRWNFAVAVGTLEFCRRRRWNFAVAAVVGISPSPSPSPLELWNSAIAFEAVVLTLLIYELLLLLEFCHSSEVRVF